MVIEVILPVRTVSEPNIRGHWARRARRAQEQRSIARMLVRAAIAGNGPITGPVSVTLTRLSPRKLDSDNLAAALKAVRDGVADALGMDDGDERLTWRYEQEKLPLKYAVRVEVSIGGVNLVNACPPLRRGV